MWSDCATLLDWSGGGGHPVTSAHLSFQASPIFTSLVMPSHSSSTKHLLACLSCLLLRSQTVVCSGHIPPAFRGDAGPFPLQSVDVDLVSFLLLYVIFSPGPSSWYSPYFAIRCSATICYCCKKVGVDHFSLHFEGVVFYHCFQIIFRTQLNSSFCFQIERSCLLKGKIQQFAGIKYNIANISAPVSFMKNVSI